MVQTRAGSRAASEALETPTREAVPAPSSLPAARLADTSSETPTKPTRAPRRSVLSSQFTPTLDSPREKGEKAANGKNSVREPTPSGHGATARRRVRQKERIRALKAYPDVGEVTEDDSGEIRGVLERLLDEGEGVSIARVAREIHEVGWEKEIPRVRGVVMAGVREGMWVIDGSGTRVSWE